VRRIEFTPKAQRDIEQIWDYSFERFGFEKAEAYLRELQRAAETVAEDPRRGLACDNIRSGYRKFPARSHILFFRASESRIVIVRILHQRMDFERHLP
jgi:toxin ParE1/3/4